MPNPKDLQRAWIAAKHEGCEISAPLLADNSLAAYMYEKGRKSSLLHGLLDQLQRSQPWDEWSPPQKELWTEIYRTLHLG